MPKWNFSEQYEKNKTNIDETKGALLESPVKKNNSKKYLTKYRPNPAHTSTTRNV